MPAKPLSDDLAREAFNAYKSAGGNASKAALQLGIPVPTFRSRLQAAKTRFPDETVPPPAQSEGTPPTSDPELQASWDLFCKCGYNRTKAASFSTLSAAGFRDRLARYASQNGIDLTKLRPEHTVAEHVDSSRHQESARLLAIKFKEATGHIAALEDKIRELEWGAKHDIAPAKWTRPETPHKKREHMPYLLTSDFQVGETIRAEETEAGYGYDAEIFRTRYRRLIDMTIALSFQHASASWAYPGIIYARGGDTISGAIHEELMRTDCLSPMEATQVAFEEESAGIAKLADAFGRVEVKAPGAGGNHDRTLLKPTTKKAFAHSYDRLIDFMLRTHFANDKRIHFQTSESFDVRFPIYGQMILLTHGDRIGSRGGQGFIGPAATIMRGAQRVVQEQAAFGRRIDRVDMGHFHTFLYYDWVLANGCLPGYSEYAKSFRMRPQPPIQTLLFHHPEHGVVDIKPITLQENKKGWKDARLQSDAT